MKTLALLCSLALPALAGASGNISPTVKYAWSETAGWSNFAPTGGGVTVYPDHLEGYAWSESAGWIQLCSHTAGGYFTYANGTNTDWGVNLNGAALSGFGWSETTGWINFKPTNGGVTINPASGVFDGWAWSESLGWVHFKGIAPAYNVLLAPNPQVNAILLSATDPLKQYVAVEGSGIYQTGNGGATWTPAATQPTDWRIEGALINPTAPATMYTATHGSGVFTSTDSGVNWIACDNTGLNLNVYSLAMDNGGNLYAGTKGGIFVSSDGCANWSPKSTNLPSSSGAYSQSMLVIDPATPTTLYAGLDGGGVYKSTDSGGTWSAANGVAPDSLTNLRVKTLSRAVAGTIYAATYGGGVFKSSDATATWAACATQPTNLNLLSLTIDAAGKLYAGTEAGVFVSNDNCASWNALNTGLPL
jgi:hypothetical protein